MEAFVGIIGCVGIELEGKNKSFVILPDIADLLNKIKWLDIMRNKLGNPGVDERSE